MARRIWDPVEVLKRFEHPATLVIGMVAVCIATLATNIAANVVSPANDFAHLAPRKISFRVGGYITALIGVLMMPWKLVADPNGYIFTWLIAYSALLGPIGGILIADYFIWRRRKLDLVALYQVDGEDRFTVGSAWWRLAALVAGVLPSLPGFWCRSDCSIPRPCLRSWWISIITRGSSVLPWRSHFILPREKSPRTRCQRPRRQLRR